ncbi:MAG: UDP-N-acetylmuramoyl-L-alanine--D-glutamate ligase [Candidatus Saccharibacteria bacterium]
MKIAIAGYGIEGESNYKYWLSDPKNDLTIVDQRQPDREIPDGAKTIISEDAFSKLNDFDIVVRTAGLNPHKIQTDGVVWSATNEFFEKCPAQIIGVTGTKGKGTTASIIVSILKESGKKVWLLGNIGIASLDYLSKINPQDIVVYELSSFQLWDLQRSPHIAVVLLVEPEHLDVHTNFEDYVDAKKNIRLYQKDEDICIFHPTNIYSRKIAESTNLGVAIRFGIEDDGGVYIKDGKFCQYEHNICSVNSLQLIGVHNLDNACAAVTAAKHFDISDDCIKKGLEVFKGLPHRLEFVRDFNGVSYYNDSFSSSVTATVAAINSFSQPEVVIIGGIDRGGNFDEIAEVISKKINVKATIVIGKIKNKLVEILNTKNLNIQIIPSDLITMQEIVELAKSFSEPGDVVILSPGCASFDMFKDFYDRGDQFRKAVNEL